MDGHHRVSVAVAAGHKTIEAHVTEVLTRMGTAGTSRCGDLLLKAAGSPAIPARHDHSDLATPQQRLPASREPRMYRTKALGRRVPIG